VSGDGSLIAAGDSQGNTTIWSTGGGKPTAELPPMKGAILGLAISPDGRLAAAGTLKGEVVIWDLTQDKLLSTHTHRFQLAARQLQFSPDSSRLAVVRGPANVELIVPGVEKSTFFPPAEVEEIHCLAFSPEGRFLAAGGRNQSPVTLYEVDEPADSQ